MHADSPPRAASPLAPQDLLQVAPEASPHYKDGLDARAAHGGFASPIRQHQRTPSAHREIKETLDARIQFMSDESDGRTYHRINQYVIIDEIGRGSYGAVHTATDQYGNEYAIKEFSKSRLRKRAQSNLLRRGPHGMPRHADKTPSLNSLNLRQRSDALYLIREEIAIMKKLNHPNLVQLIEVLDDPEQDSLYMVLEMCKNGVVMKVGLDGDADAYDDETCRCWFRDLILGIEYLHAQGVIHRDIKPDNLLLSEHNVLKVTDFGVSEMFEKPESMMTAKSAGSPAFLPPELCGKHGEVSGTAADIWSMGVSLFCLKYGKLPFNRPGVLEIYDAIKMDDACMPEGEDPDFVHVMSRLLHKDASKRITMAELREHPWVTKRGTDPLLSAQENCAHLIEPPNELELKRAFTRKMNHLLCVMKAIHKFKALLGDIRSKAAATRDDDGAQQAEMLGNHTPKALDDEPARFIYLGIGPGGASIDSTDADQLRVVSASPAPVDFDVYSRAYQDAVNSRLSDQSSKPTLYLNRFVRETEQLGGKIRNLVVGAGASSEAQKSPENDIPPKPEPGRKLTHLVSKVAGSSTPKPETSSRGA